jgi:hypothetical protein
VGIVLIPGKRGENLLCRSLLELLHEVDGGCGGLGSNQEVKVIGHRHPADQEESGLLAELAQRLNQGPAEALAGKEPAATIGACGDKLQLAGLKMASLDMKGISAGMALNVSRMAGLALRQPALINKALRDYIESGKKPTLEETLRRVIREELRTSP